MTARQRIDERWHETWTLAGVTPPTHALDELVRRHAEPHRAYHTIDHVMACLGHASSVRAELRDPAALELALWYHDAVYDTHRHDNEARSAALAASTLDAAGMPSGQRVAALVLATRHPSDPVDDDARMLVDIDLAILGAPPAAFDAYEAAIRREYGWVPEPDYRSRRAALLRAFLARPRIFRTDHFSAAFEASARANLARSMARLVARDG